MLDGTDWVHAAQQLGVLAGVGWVVQAAIGAAVTDQPGAKPAGKAAPHGGQRLMLAVGHVGQACRHVSTRPSPNSPLPFPAHDPHFGLSQPGVSPRFPTLISASP